jgi:hypothetical protein
MSKPGDVSATTIAFTKIGPGLYQSNAYDGHRRMRHHFVITTNYQGGGYNMTIDGLWYGGYRTIKLAKAAATRIERKP